MSRVHDMGGRFGTGAIRPEESTDGIPPLEPWQARALALTLAAGSLGAWNIDVSRHARECLDARDYMRFSYFEKWLAALADLLVARGVLTAQDMTAEGNDRMALVEQALQAIDVASVLSKGSPYDRPGTGAARFAPGDAVRARRRATNPDIPGGHTRLPAYAAGAHGRVLLCHGSHVLPDKSAHDLGECPEPLYAVAFPAFELWDAPEHPDDEVILDMWDSYLEPI